MNKEQLAEILFNIISKQSFESWHSTDFEDYITGESDAPTKEEVLKTLEEFISREIR